MYQRQNHFPTSTLSKDGVRHPICQTLEHESRTNIMATPIDCPHNIRRSSIGMMLKMGQFDYSHWGDDMVHNYTHGPFMFDHFNSPTITH